jgi:hypothetical protein
VRWAVVARGGEYARASHDHSPEESDLSQDDAQDATKPTRMLRRRWPAVLVGVLVGVVAWGGMTGRAALGAAEDLRSAERTLAGARAALEDGDLEEVETSLGIAAVQLADADAALGRPSVVAASAVPVLGRDLRVARAISRGALEVVEAGAATVATVRAGAETSDSGGTGLPLGLVEAAAPDLRRTADAATAAVDRLDAAPADVLVTEVADARTRMRELLVPVRDAATNAAVLADQLPAFLGADGPRRYLLAAANPAELRGVGGYLGSLAVVELHGGALDIGGFQALSDLPELAAGAVDPALLPARWEAFGATRRWKNVNATPDLPSAGGALVAMWEAHTGERVDGVIVVDPFALASMLEVTGPVQALDGTTLTADNAVDYLTNGAYATFEDAEDQQGARQDSLGADAATILTRFLSDTAGALERIDDLAGMVGDRHLQLYATDPQIQAAFAAAGIDGSLSDPAGDLVAVVANSGTSAKLDYWLGRRLRYDVRLLQDGAADATLAVTFVNDAPTQGQPRYVIGPNVTGLEAGQNRFHTSVYCSSRCAPLTGEGGLRGRLLLEEELGHPVAAGWVDLPAGGSDTLVVRWRTAGAWAEEDGALVYRLTVRAQTSVRAPEIEVNVAVPEGLALADGRGGVVTEARADGVVATWRGEVRGDLALTFRFVPTGGAPTSPDDGP